jgi:hypothetical protein
VNLFYRVLIPAVIGAMTLFVMVDAVRRILSRFQRKGASPPAQTAEPGQAGPNGGAGAD